MFSSSFFFSLLRLNPMGWNPNIIPSVLLLIYIFFVVMYALMWMNLMLGIERAVKSNNKITYLPSFPQRKEF